MGTWQLDPHRTRVEFSAKHLAVMKVRGHFAELSATADIDPGHPESAFVEVTIDAASIRTHQPQRDDEVRSANFLDVANHPTITFRSTGVEVLGGDRYRLSGELTIKGTARPVVLEVKKGGELDDETTGHRIAYRASTEINRKDFGLTFNVLLDGPLVVSDNVRVEIEGELVEQKEPVTG
jgi:polyisoprenoid-binding protein YceI